MPLNYYNEWDVKTAQWLENLVAAKRLPRGYVDRTDIREIHPVDLRDYQQCHFFAGIGGWPLALQMAGWPDDVPVWTGSCPCQPFSNAGQQKGTDDERHLWPTFKSLIAKHLPPVVFGEQVASKLGRSWLSDVQADLEALGYSFGAADLCGASVGSPHIRQRLFWVGYSNDARLEGRFDVQRSGELTTGASGVEGGLSNSECGRLEGRDKRSPSQKAVVSAQNSKQSWAGWDDVEWLDFTDGKRRPIEPGSFPLADGVPHRVELIRGYGNAIIPEVAATFIRSFMEAV